MVHQPSQVCLELLRNPWVMLSYFLVHDLYSLFLPEQIGQEGYTGHSTMDLYVAIKGLKVREMK